MMILFISKGEVLFGLILAVLLVLYGWSGRAGFIQRKVWGIPDDNLMECFYKLSEEYAAKPAYWKKMELNDILREIKRRNLLQKMSTEELISNYQSICEKDVVPSSFKDKAKCMFYDELKRRHAI